MNLEDQEQTGQHDGALAGAASDSVPVFLDSGNGAPSELRRRLLLRGLIGAPVTLAVMQPVRTLAKAKKYCHYSGWHSFKIDAHSSALPKQKKCKGGRTKYYYKKKINKLPKSKKKKTKGGNKKKWGYKSKSGYKWGYKGKWGTNGGIIVQVPNYHGTTITLTQSTRFSDLFGSGSTQTIGQCLGSGGTYGAFLTALFNAFLYNSSGYPFSYSQVYAIWSNPTVLGMGVSHYQAALFFSQLDSIG